MAPPDITKVLPLVEWQLSISFAQSASEYPTRLPPVALYHSTKSSVPFRYRNILFTAVRCASVGSELNLETTPTAWAMSG